MIVWYSLRITVTNIVHVLLVPYLIPTSVHDIRHTDIHSKGLGIFGFSTAERAGDLQELLSGVRSASSLRGLTTDSTL